MQKPDTIVQAARLIQDATQDRPEAFKTKRRAPGVWPRALCWCIGILIGSGLDKWLTGTTFHPAPIIAVTILLSAFVYFDPPEVKVTHTWKGKLEE